MRVNFKKFSIAVGILFLALPAAPSFAAIVGAPITKNLSIGMTSAQVAYLQDFLKEQGSLPLSQASTGYFGSVTKKAVIAYQKKNNISQTGTVGPLTRASIVAKTPLQFSAWLPYWKKADSATEAKAHVGVFAELSPFAYGVRQDGTLIDTAKMAQEPWPELIAAAKSRGVKILPSILWNDTAAIYEILKNSASRSAHEKAIVQIVTENNFDGIDLDYENKSAETKNYFSAFVKELAALLHAKNKILVCTVEPRTPLDSRFVNIPADIEYSNDYSALNAACDEVRIMAYDQMTIDLKLNKEKGNLGTYVPVADTAWVKKVAELALKEISPRKLVIGVPTYGYEFKVTPNGRRFDYEKQNSINPSDAISQAQAVGATPIRNAAGEMNFTYFNPSDATTTAENASTTSPARSFRVVSWSDAQAIGEKVALAKFLGARGVAVFKIDGSQDPNIWEVLQ